METNINLQRYLTGNTGLLIIGVFFFIPPLFYFMPEAYYWLLLLPFVTIFLYKIRYSEKKNKSWFDLTKIWLVIVSSLSYSLFVICTELIEKKGEIFIEHERWFIIYYILFYLSSSSFIAMGIALLVSFLIKWSGKLVDRFFDE